MAGSVSVTGHSSSGVTPSLSRHGFPGRAAPRAARGSDFGNAALHPYEGCQEGRSDFARLVLVRLTSCGAQRTRSESRAAAVGSTIPFRVALAQWPSPNYLFKALFPFFSRSEE